jgi:hypothetical protein
MPPSCEAGRERHPVRDRHIRAPATQRGRRLGSPPGRRSAFGATRGGHSLSLGTPKAPKVDPCGACLPLPGLRGRGHARRTAEAGQGGLADPGDRRARSSAEAHLHLPCRSTKSAQRGEVPRRGSEGRSPRRRASRSDLRGRHSELDWNARWRARWSPLGERQRHPAAHHREIQLRRPDEVRKEPADSDPRPSAALAGEVALVCPTETPSLDLAGAGRPSLADCSLFGFLSRPSARTVVLEQHSGSLRRAGTTRSLPFAFGANTPWYLTRRGSPSTTPRSLPGRSTCCGTGRESRLTPASPV